MKTRSRGHDLFVSRRVTIVDGDAWRVDATVQGSRIYAVSLVRKGDDIEAWCMCPTCDDSFELCRHIWATVLAAEAKGHLQGTGQPARNLRLVEPKGELEQGGGSRHETALPPPKPVPSEAVRRPKPRPRGRPREAEAWKKDLAVLRSTAEQPPAIRKEPLPPGHEIVYIVDVHGTLAGNGLVIDVATRRRKKDGEWTKPAGRRFSQIEIDRLPDPDDRQILAILAGGRGQAANYYYGMSYYETTPARFVLTEMLRSELLPRICATGRCLLQKDELDGPAFPIRWDDAGPWECWLKVKSVGAGRTYVTRGEFRRGEERMPMEAPHLLLSGGVVFWEDRVAKLQDFNAFPWISLLRQRGELRVPAGQGQEFLKELLSLPDMPPIELPKDLRYEEVTPEPRPHLTIKPRDDRGRAATRDMSTLIGELSFEYEGHVVPAESPDRGVFDLDARRLLRRDREAERSLAARLEDVGFHRKLDYYRQKTVLELPSRNLPKVTRALLNEGWHIEAQGKLYRKAGDFRIELTSGIDWFEVHGGATFDGQEVPLPALLAALRRGEDLVPLGDGSFGLLPEEWLKKYAPLAGVGTAEEDHLRFRSTQVGLLDILLAEQPEVRFDERFERARERLRQFQGITPADPPEGFRGELRGYQRDGLGWLHFLREFGFGGCLADDMGLGKTVQVLALLEARRKLRASAPKDRRIPPSLVVVPRSLVFNWKEEAARFTPGLRLLDNTGIGRGKPGEGFDDCDVVLATYGTLRRDIVELKDYRFDYAILDEAQAIKNASSQSAKAARLIQADHRLALSGTPVENHLGELWSLFEFLNPGMLGQSEEMSKAGLGLRKADEDTRSLLARALRPFILRRTKAQVAEDLPEKTEQTIFCDLEPAQRKLYDELRDHYRNSLLHKVASEGIGKSKIQILEALLRLRQAACHPGLIDKTGHSAESSGKLEVLLPQLREVVEEGHKALVFSQFTSMLAIVKQRLDGEGIPYTYLDGRTRDRQARVQEFQDDPDCRVFLISLKAGGVGLNLTAAEYIFLLDPWWNPAVESQAIDRAHRIGQTRPVFAYRLIATDTVEEKVLQLQADKRALADAIINADNSLIGNLGREELELLLS